MTEAITQQTGSSSFVPYSIRPVSDPYPLSSFEEEKSRKGAPFAQQDKGLVQSASVPTSECLGQWETHMAEKKEKRKLTHVQRDDLKDVSRALKDCVLAKLEEDGSFLCRVRSRVFIDRHWALLSKDWKKRNPMVPEVLHDGYGYVKDVAKSMFAGCGIRLPENLMETAVKEMFWWFLVGGHSYVRDSIASEA